MDEWMDEWTDESVLRPGVSAAEYPNMSWTDRVFSKHLLLADVRVGDQLLNKVIQAHLPFFDEGCNRKQMRLYFFPL